MCTALCTEHVAGQDHLQGASGLWSRQGAVGAQDGLETTTEHEAHLQRVGICLPQDLPFLDDFHAFACARVYVNVDAFVYSMIKLTMSVPGRVWNIVGWDRMR